MISSLAIVLAVVAAAPGEPDWSSADIMYMARYVMGYRTDPSTWAAEPAFGLRMGMGPGDVMARIKAIKVIIPDTNVREGQAALYDATVGTLHARVSLNFLRGRLYSVEVDPSLYRILSKTMDLSSEGMERSRKERWEWTREVLGALTTELGKPVCAPSERTIGRFCFNVAPLPGCALTGRDKTEKLFRWVWRVGRTETILTGTGKLEYRDIEAMRRVSLARDATHRDWAARHAEQKAADRSRITGAPPPATLASPEAERVADTEDAAEPEPWPLECYADDDEPSRDQRTTRATWSKAGWDQYRWGMGPADVKDLFPPSKEDSVHWDPGTLEPASYLLLDARVLEAPSSSRFRFVDGRLFSITHQPDCMTGAQDGVDCVAWSRKVEGIYNKKCGDGRCTRDGKYIECEWLCGDTENVSLSRYDAGQFQSVSLTYADPSKFAKRAPGSAKKISTPAKSWSEQGWFGFRYSMGPGDVQRRLSAAGGEFRAKREMACVAGKDNPKELECRLERDFHAMSVGGLKPTLEFDFLSGRLYRVVLQFPQRLEQSEFEQARDRLRVMLLDKYGKPTQELGDKEDSSKSLSLHWDSNDVSISYWAMMSYQGSQMFIHYFSGATYQKLKREGHGGAEGDKL